MSALNMPEHLIESFPLIRTTSYRRVVLEEQICFLEQIHPLVQDLQHAEERVAIAQRVLAHARKQAQSIWNKRIAQARKAVNEAEKRVRESTRAMHDANERFSQAQDRLEALRQGRLSPEDNQRILRAMESAVEPYDREIESMEIAKQDLQSRISQLRRTHEQLTRELAEVEEEHRAWSQGLLPPRVEEAVVSAMKKAESAHAAEVEKLHKEIERMSQKRIAESEKAENLRAKLVRLEEEVAALKRQQEGGFPSWLCSLFSTFMYDPRREHEAVQRQLDAVTARVNDLKVKLESHTQKWQELVSQKDGWIDQAAREEKERQYQNFRERRSRLARELGDCQQSLESCSSELSNVEQRLTEAHENREKVMESARTQAWNSLLEEAENEVIEGKQACDRAQRETELARQLSENAAKAYQELMAAEAEFFQCELAEYHRELDQTLAECEALRQQIAKQMSDHGIAPPEPLNFPNLLGLRDSLQQEHESLMTGQKANNRPPLVRRVIRRDVQAFEEEIFASGQLYLDFECNANDYLDRDGENWPGLLGQLQEIRRRHRGLLFPDLSEDADLLEAFLAMFFPEDIVRDYFVANISLSDERVFLMIRPAVITPRMEAALPAGVILAICGRLHDHRVNSDNPVLLVQRIVELSPCRQRPFEGRIRVKTVTSTDMIYPGRKRQNNVLTQAFIEALPPISRQTKQRLQEWEEYLDWKEQLVKCKLDGVRYLTRDLVMKGASPRIRFLIVAENSEAFDSSKRVLKQSELAAFGLDYSLNPWRFEYNENHRSAACELGDFVTLEAGKAGGLDKLVQDVPWPQPGWGWALFRLSERMQLLFEEWQEAGRELGHIEQTILKEVPQEGFLSFSVVGDIALIKRQRSALKKLEKQSGFAPLLSSYLFDIKAADEPAELITIADDEWFRKDLNADQRLAVRKMISAPDLALVQGPPGTGKTTMIAEAIWQFVRRGECVLVASQANLAVDNALERLAEAPEIRAIRLGSRVDEDCPYHRKQVLHTYYRAISRACSQRILQRWQDMDKLERELSAWLDSLNMVAADLEALHNNEQKLLAELKDIQQKIEAAYERERPRRDQEQQQQRVKRFLDFLEGREPLCENIPKEFRTVLLSELHPLLDKLENSGIVLDKQGSVWSAVSSGEQCL
ncbi:MAG: AAA domain-containing protein, partial [Candidatus Hadarchaeum sp.]